MRKLLLKMISDLGKCPNQKTHEICKYAYLRVFWFRHIPRSKYISKSSFLIKCYIITVLQKKIGAFRSVFKKSKIVISKSDLGGGGGKIVAKKKFDAL